MAQRPFPIARSAMRVKLQHEEKQFLEDAKRRGPGTYTATQTGAKKVAKTRQAVREIDDLADSVMATPKMEKKIRTGKSR